MYTELQTVNLSGHTVLVSRVDTCFWSNFHLHTGVVDPAAAAIVPHNALISVVGFV